MRSRTLLKVVSCAMLLVFPVATFAADSGIAVVYPDHAINLNGSLLDRSQAVVDGDQLRTNNGGATIALAGATLQMGAASEVVFHPTGARVMNGALTITTSRALGTEIANLRVEPVSGRARYLVSQQGSKIVIAAMEGSVRVTDGNQNVVVPTNKALLAKLETLPVTASGKDSELPPQDKDKNQQGGNPTTGAVPAAGVGVTLSRADLIAIGLIAAGGGAALAIGLASRQPASGTH